MLNPQDTVATLGEVPGVAALSDHTLAYIGPGAGLGAILIVVALALGAVLLLVGLVWYPLKRLVGSRRSDPADQAAATDSASGAETADAASGSRTDEVE